jgi:hypothetical protein
MKSNKRIKNMKSNKRIQKIKYITKKDRYKKKYSKSMKGYGCQAQECKTGDVNIDNSELNIMFDISDGVDLTISDVLDYVYRETPKKTLSVKITNLGKHFGDAIKEVGIPIIVMYFTENKVLLDNIIEEIEKEYLKDLVDSQTIKYAKDKLKEYNIVEKLIPSKSNGIMKSTNKIISTIKNIPMIGKIAKLPGFREFVIMVQSVAPKIKKLSEIKAFDVKEYSRRDEIQWRRIERAYIEYKFLDEEQRLIAWQQPKKGSVLSYIDNRGRFLHYSEIISGEYNMSIILKCIFIITNIIHVYNQIYDDLNKIGIIILNEGIKDIMQIFIDKYCLEIGKLEFKNFKGLLYDRVYNSVYNINNTIPTFKTYINEILKKELNNEFINQIDELIEYYLQVDIVENNEDNYKQYIEDLMSKEELRKQDIDVLNIDELRNLARDRGISEQQINFTFDKEELQNLILGIKPDPMDILADINIYETIIKGLRDERDSKLFDATPNEGSEITKVYKKQIEEYQNEIALLKERLY